MGKLITEIFNIKNGLFTKKNGEKIKIAYIDPSTSESTYEHKDKIKNQFGAAWIGTLKTWGWFLGNQPEQVYNTKIKPCLEYLMSVEKNKPSDDKREVISIIDDLLRELQGATMPNVAEVGVKSMSKEEIQDKVASFKEELLNIMSDEEFKAKLMSIIKFRNAQGHKFSFRNTILFLVQDPEATLVKSKSNWFAMNRTVKPNAKPIALWVPKGGKSLTADEKRIRTRNFCDSCGVKDVKDLNPGEKERLKVILKGYQASSFDLMPNFYDYRFTEQMTDKEDLVGDPNAKLPWFDDSGEETPETVKFVDSLIEIINEVGIKVNYVDDLNGARGVSMSGTIEVLKNEPKNSGMFNTLTHEFAHELLHQRYLHNNNEDLKSYFIGTKQGRAVVEQQAELSAWIVLRNFGFDMETNINYVGMWGMDEKNAAKVFDTVASVSEEIIRRLGQKMSTNITESLMRLVENRIDGYGLAKMLGFEDLYVRSKKLEKQNTVTENYKSLVNRINKLHR